MSQDMDVEFDINAMDYYIVNNNNKTEVNNRVENKSTNNMNNNFNNIPPKMDFKNSYQNDFININPNSNFNNIYTKQHSRKCLCEFCIGKFLKCETCGGYFLIKKYTEKHKEFCLKLYNNYKEKTELIICQECNLLVKFSDYRNHSKSCSSTNFKNQKLECQHCKKTFSLEVIEEHELACAKVQTDLMLLKEIADCSFCKEKVPLLHIESHETSCKKIQENQDKIDKMIKSDGSLQFPDFWEKNNARAKKVGSKIYIVPLDPHSEEFFSVQEKFLYTLQYEGYEIAYVWRIQNLGVWEKYHRERLRIKQEKNFLEEKQLFFGNKNIQAELICKNGFDISFAVDNANYGRGIYFNLRADKVIDQGHLHKVDKTKFVFLADVIVGIPHVQSNSDYSMRKPPFYDKDNFIYYDSVTNVDNFSNLKDVDQTFVVYNNEKAYPTYMIEYYHKNNIY